VCVCKALWVVGSIPVPVPVPVPGPSSNKLQFVLGVGCEGVKRGVEGVKV
jgi:hypothetical protein